MDPLELGIIAIMAVALFLWGPQKIPDLARALGRARREFDAASKEFQKATNMTGVTGIPGGTSTNSIISSFLAPAAEPPTSTAPPMMGPVSAPTPLPPARNSGDELLIDTARKLGIATQGKTREQVQQEIIDLAKKAPDKPGSSETPVSG